MAKHPPPKERVSLRRLWASVPDGLSLRNRNGSRESCDENTTSGRFFEVEEREVDPPAGKLSNDFIAAATPTNCWRRPTIIGFRPSVRKHHASRLAHISFERFQKRIESVREPEAIAEWLEKMKRRLHYRLKTDSGAPQTRSPLRASRRSLRPQKRLRQKRMGRSSTAWKRPASISSRIAKKKLVRPAYSARFSGKGRFAPSPDHGPGSAVH